MLISDISNECFYLAFVLPFVHLYFFSNIHLRKLHESSPKFAVLIITPRSQSARRIVPLYGTMEYLRAGMPNAGIREVIS